MKTRIVLHSFDELSFVLIPTETGNTSMRNPGSTNSPSAAPPGKVRPVPAWLATAKPDHPSADRIASSHPASGESGE